VAELPGNLLDPVHTHNEYFQLSWKTGENLNLYRTSVNEFPFPVSFWGFLPSIDSGMMGKRCLLNWSVGNLWLVNDGIIRERRSHELVVWRCIMVGVGMVVGRAAYRHCVMYHPEQAFPIVNGRQEFLLLGRYAR
jgi:hypothetical protein